MSLYFGFVAKASEDIKCKYPRQSLVVAMIIVCIYNEFLIALLDLSTTSLIGCHCHARWTDQDGVRICAKIDDQTILKK